LNAVGGIVFGANSPWQTGTGTYNLNGGTLAVGAGSIVAYNQAEQGAPAWKLNLGGGTLQATGSFTIGSSSFFTMALTANGSTIDTQGNTVTIGTPIVGDYSLTKMGTGTLTLTGTNRYTGGTTVNAGKLLVNGSIAGSSGVNVVAGATLGGSGAVSAISGGGLVSVGNSPGILTATTVNPAGGLDFGFEFTQTGSPNYSSATASGNDVLHLTGSTPFSSSFGSANAVSVYLDVAGIALNEQFRGGIYSNAPGDFTSSVSGGAYSYYIFGDGHGLHLFNGTYYYTLGEYDATHGNLSVALSFVAETANFGGGNISGEVMQFAVVPEPGTFSLLLVLASSLAGYGCLKRRGC
jgi:autotransporter-associated beta strand protein